MQPDDKSDCPQTQEGTAANTTHEHKNKARSMPIISQIGPGGKRGIMIRHFTLWAECWEEATAASDTLDELMDVHGPGGCAVRVAIIPEDQESEPVHCPFDTVYLPRHAIKDLETAFIIVAESEGFPC